MIISMTESWSGFCNQTETMMYDDPSLTVSPKTFLKELCQLDFTEMTNEVMRYQVLYVYPARFATMSLLPVRHQRNILLKILIID